MNLKTLNLDSKLFLDSVQGLPGILGFTKETAASPCFEMRKWGCEVGGEEATLAVVSEADNQTPRFIAKTKFL